MLKIRRSRDRLIFNMGIPYPDRRFLYWNAAQDLFRVDSYIVFVWTHSLCPGKYAHGFALACFDLLFFTARAHFTYNFSIQMWWKFHILLSHIFKELIDTKFRTWYDSCAVVACTKLCCDMNYPWDVLYIWASYQIVKSRVAHASVVPGTFSPPPRVGDPDMHHGTCVTHLPRCMPGSPTSGFLWSRGGENVPGIPGACTTRNFTYLIRGSWNRIPVVGGMESL